MANSSSRVKWVAVSAALGVSLLIGGCSLFDSPPAADFSWSPLEPLARNEVHFSDLSTDTGGLFSSAGITSRLWDFGDGMNSSAANPVHRYRCEGEYEVSLKVTDRAGLTTVEEKVIHVQPSLYGTWKGTLWDALKRPFDLELELYQSTPGNITGTAYVNGKTCNIISASFDPTGKKVRISFSYWPTGSTWLLVGDYLAYPNCEPIKISGYWENITISRRIGDWEVSLQNLIGSSSLEKAEDESTEAF